MSLASGTRLGTYEIVALLGAGGMGEVYRARDIRLKRDVAIKILPAAFANDPDRLARFQREAEVIASLSHPNIAQIHGLEDSDGTRALVLELVEGETLADRIDRGPIPFDEALPIARQIAEALEAAHELGIIHRDLKPANIKITPDGTMKVLDFGLAKALEPTSGPGLHASGVSHSPTITSPALITGAAVILGTAAYMSPEQAKGRPADKRSDVWSFGCVFYEMLTGKRPFDGDDVVDVLGAVARLEPDWTAIPAHVPTAISALLKGCLIKDRRKRIGDISTARFVLDGLPADSKQTQPTPKSPRWALIGVPAAAVLLAGAAGAFWWNRQPPGSMSQQRSSRVSIDVATEAPLRIDVNGGVAISPDGRTIAFTAISEGSTEPSLYLRRIDEWQPRVVAGTVGASNHRSHLMANGSLSGAPGH